jgi:5-hydroxyisourate hydrolase
MTISTHVLDTSLGRPAAGVALALQRQHGSSWVDLSRGETTADGRAASLVPPGADAPAGAYRLTFDVGAYFSSRGVESFYARVAIDFLVRDASAHYHVPLLVSPYGYSTYRGT